MPMLAATLAGAAVDPHMVLLLSAVFAAVALFVMVGVSLFASGWQSYEQRYVSSAERTLEAMYLAVPAQQVAYLSVLCFVLVSLLWLWMFHNVAVAPPPMTTGMSAPPAAFRGSMTMTAPISPTPPAPRTPTVLSTPATR